VVAPFVIWQLKADTVRREQGGRAVNFQLSMLLAVIGTLVCLISVIRIPFPAVFFVAGIVDLIFVLVAAAREAGEALSLPMIRFFKQP
jgi:uncharacterized Tic20 family protein